MRVPRGARARGEVNVVGPHSPRSRRRGYRVDVHVAGEPAVGTLDGVEAASGDLHARYSTRMGEAELLIAGLLVAVAGLSALARACRCPTRSCWSSAAPLFGFVPGLPEVELDPEVVLVVFLPPLLYASAIFANFGDLRANLRGLTLSTVGLVLVDHGRGGVGGARAHPGAALGGRLRARGDRLADRPAGGGDDHAAPRRPRDGSSAPSRARGCSTTPPRSWPTASRWPPSWPGASPSPMPA